MNNCFKAIYRSLKLAVKLQSNTANFLLERNLAKKKFPIHGHSKSNVKSFAMFQSQYMDNCYITSYSSEWDVDIKDVPSAEN